MLRANILPSDVSVIPNAVDCTAFTPNPAARKSNSITIVCLTRLVYRKGVDLMVEIIPAICKHFDHVNFIIGKNGSGKSAIVNALIAADRAHRWGVSVALSAARTGLMPCAGERVTFRSRAVRMEGLDATEERAIRAEGEKVKRAGRTAFCELPWAARVQKLVEGSRLLKLSTTSSAVWKSK